VDNQLLVGQQGPLAVHIGRGPLAAQAAFLASRKLLHDADRTHGHEVARCAECVVAGNRQVLQTDDQLGIGQLAGGTDRGFGGRHTRGSGTQFGRLAVR